MSGVDLMEALGIKAPASAAKHDVMTGLDDLAETFAFSFSTGQALERSFASSAAVLFKAVHGVVPRSTVPFRGVPCRIAPYGLVPCRPVFGRTVFDRAVPHCSVPSSDTPSQTVTCCAVTCRA